MPLIPYFGVCDWTAKRVIMLDGAGIELGQEEQDLLSSRCQEHTIFAIDLDGRS